MTASTTPRSKTVAPRATKRTLRKEQLKNDLPELIKASFDKNADQVVARFGANELKARSQFAVQCLLDEAAL